MAYRCHRLLLALIVISACSGCTPLLVLAQAPAQASDIQPENFKYAQLWSDEQTTRLQVQELPIHLPELSPDFYIPVAPLLVLAPAPAPASDIQPENFKYTQLWSDETGETHIAECKMQGFRQEAYSSLLQFVRDDFGGNATKMVFTELSVNLTQPLHNTPSVQFVIALSGSWYIETTDGSYREFLPGEVLFQDNTNDSPAAKSPQHYSGVVGDVPCQQFVVQFDRMPNVNDVCPFST